MKREHIEFVLGKLGCYKIHASTDWVRSSCPLAPWKHRKGADNHPSFSVSIEPDGKSYYRCFGCDSKGSLETLIWEIERLSGKSLERLGSFVMEWNSASVEGMADRIRKLADYTPTVESVDLGGFKARKTRRLARMVEEQAEIPEEVLAPMKEALANNAEVRAYLNGRGISDESIERWELGWVESANRIAVPVRDMGGKIRCISGRAFREGQKPKWMHSKGFKKDLYLYGERFAESDGFGRCFLVEGFFDVIALDQAGFSNVFAIMGSSIGQIQAEKIVRMFTEAVIVPDGDEPGAEAARRIVKTLKDKVRVKVFPTPFGKDPDEIDPNAIRDFLEENP